MLSKKVVFGVLFCVGASLCGLDLLGANMDVVPDEEAASVVGGGCPCITYEACGAGEGGCTGGGLIFGGACGFVGDQIFNNSVCGGSCSGGPYGANSSGCGS